MSEHVNPYLEGIKDWKIRDITVGYLNAREIFKEYEKNFQNGIILSFEKLKEISDLLWHAKEGLYQIFKRVVNPKQRKFENAKKFTPNEAEISFMNNVGLLFHKIMVARELKYVLDHYEVDSESYQDIKNELDINLRRIDLLFDEGITILTEMIRGYSTNIPLLTFLLENEKQVESAFGKKSKTIIEQLLNGEDIEKAYFSVAKYYLESGWHDQARNMFKKTLKINPDHQEAKAYLGAA